VVRQPGEERLAIQVLGSGLAGADGVDQVAERRVVRLHQRDGQVTHRAGLAAGQRLPQRSQGKDAGLRLGEHARAGERAQQPVQGRRVRAGVLGQDRHRRRAGRQVIGDAQHRGGIQRLRELEPGQQLGHLHRRRKFVSLHGSPQPSPVDLPPTQAAPFVRRMRKL
jgi:hypothetical protein